MNTTRNGAVRVCVGVPSKTHNAPDEERQLYQTALFWFHQMVPYLGLVTAVGPNE